MIHLGGGAPVIVSGSEDGMIKIWNTSTYRLENTLNYGLERAWCVALNSNSVEERMKSQLVSTRAW
jgi:hypothetical protein